MAGGGGAEEEAELGMTADAEEPSAGAGTGAEAPTGTAFRTLADIELDFSEDGTPPLRRSSTARCSSPPALAKARRTRASSKPMENMTGRAASHEEDKEGNLFIRMQLPSATY